MIEIEDRSISAKEQAFMFEKVESVISFTNYVKVL